MSADVGRDAAPGARPDPRRRENLSAVLRLVHEGRAASRADLTRITGLNRSTVAALVAELSERELLREGDPEATRRVGRPSPRVRAHPSPVAIAVNPELDAVTVAAVGLGAAVERRVRVRVDGPVAPEEVASIVSAALPELAVEGRRLAGVGVAVPGLVRAVDGLVRWAPHLGWTDAAIAPLLEAAVGAPARVANDASLGALAERVFGAGRGVDDLVYLNGGASGIGGGVIAGGAPIRGVAGFAGEFGHTRPGATDDLVTSGGVLEDEVNRARLLAVLDVPDADETELDRALLESTDPAVVTEVARQRRVLAVAIGNAVTVLDPETVVLGGFLATLLRSDPEGLAELVAQAAVAPLTERARIQVADLGPDRLLIGAADLAFESLLADPTLPLSE